MSFTSGGDHGKKFCRRSGRTASCAALLFLRFQRTDDADERGCLFLLFRPEKRPAQGDEECAPAGRPGPPAAGFWRGDQSVALLLPPPGLLERPVAHDRPGRLRLRRAALLRTGGEGKNRPLPPHRVERRIRLGAERLLGSRLLRLPPALPLFEELFLLRPLVVGGRLLRLLPPGHGRAQGRVCGPGLLEPGSRKTNVQALGVHPSGPLGKEFQIPFPDLQRVGQPGMSVLLGPSAFSPRPRSGHPRRTGLVGAERQLGHLPPVVLEVPRRELSAPALLQGEKRLLLHPLFPPGNEGRKDPFGAGAVVLALRRAQGGIHPRRRALLPGKGKLRHRGKLLRHRTLLPPEHLRDDGKIQSPLDPFSFRKTPERHRLPAPRCEVDPPGTAGRGQVGPPRKRSGLSAAAVGIFPALRPERDLAGTGFFAHDRRRAPEPGLPPDQDRGNPEKTRHRPAPRTRDAEGTLQLRGATRKGGETPPRTPVRQSRLPAPLALLAGAAGVRLHHPLSADPLVEGETRKLLAGPAPPLVGKGLRLRDGTELPVAPLRRKREPSRRADRGEGGARRGRPGPCAALPQGHADALLPDRGRNLRYPPEARRGRPAQRRPGEDRSVPLRRCPVPEAEARI